MAYVCVLQMQRISGLGEDERLNFFTCKYPSKLEPKVSGGESMEFGVCKARAQTPAFSLLAQELWDSCLVGHPLQLWSFCPAKKVIM